MIKLTCYIPSKIVVLVSPNCLSQPYLNGATMVHKHISKIQRDGKKIYTKLNLQH